MDIKAAKKKLAATLKEIKAAGFLVTYADYFGIQVEEMRKGISIDAQTGNAVVHDANGRISCTFRSGRKTGYQG